MIGLPFAWQLLYLFVRCVINIAGTAVVVGIVTAAVVIIALASATVMAMTVVGYAKERIGKIS